MTSTPRTSFVIATRDRSQELCATLDRLLDTFQYLIMLVDNASRDDSVAAASRVASRSTGRVAVIPLNRNAGAVARNVGVARSSTPYVAFCDDDSWWAAEAIQLAEQTSSNTPPWRFWPRARCYCRSSVTTPSSPNSRTVRWDMTRPCPGRPYSPSWRARRW